MRNILLLSAVIFVSACSATGSLYNWGDYEEDLFTYYSKPEKQEKVLADLIEHLEAQEEKGSKPAPGMYAEVGTMFLERNDSGRAIEYYRKEAANWPESRPVMMRLIKNLEAS